MFEKVAMDDPERDTETFWLRRAREVRTAAERMQHPETRSALTFIASIYQRLADRAKQRSRSEDESR
jgi:hypothetical protein